MKALKRWQNQKLSAAFNQILEECGRASRWQKAAAFLLKWQNSLLHKAMVTWVEVANERALDLHYWHNGPIHAATWRRSWLCAKLLIPWRLTTSLHRDARRIFNE